MLLERLIRETGLKRSSVETLAATASKRYFVFPIDKRDGGQRLIAHPAKPIKFLQRWTNYRLLKPFQIHECATAYKKGSSIKLNAQAHLGSLYTTRIDIECFFPSFKRAGIEKFLLDRAQIYNHYDAEDVSFFSRIMTRNGELTIGAPTSPWLTNAMMFDFDNQFNFWCQSRDLVYTRYADDLFVSSTKAFTMDGVEAAVSHFLDAYPYATLKVNNSKTCHLSKKNQRSITGLILTTDNNVSIGRKKKRKIKSLVWNFKNNRITAEEEGHLRGLVSFSFDVDRQFYEQLARKYGIETLMDLMGRPKVRRKTETLPF